MDLETINHREKPAGDIYVYVVASVAAVGGLIFGYDLNIMSGSIIFIRDEWGLTPTQIGAAMSSAMLGCIAGPVFGGALADRIGRRRSLQIAVLLFAVSAVGTAIPPDLETFCVFRFIGGMGVGLASIVSPMYIAEIAPARIRGRLVHINQMAIVVGALVSGVVAWLLSFSAAWRWMFATELIPIGLLMIGLCFVPRSPRWLCQQARKDEALATLSKINGRRQAEEEMRSIQNALNQEEGSFRELLGPGIRRALLIAFGIALFSQITGASAIMFYMPIIFQEAGFSNPSDSIFWTVIVYIFNLFGTFLVWILIDRAGRRPLLLVGTAGLTLGLIIMGLFFHIGQTGSNVIMAMFLTKGSYLISLGPLSWLIMSEVFPTRVRAKGMAICSLAVWVGSFSSNQILPNLMEFMTGKFGSSAGAYWIFAWICLLAFLFGLFLVPETKRKSLEAIQEMWKVSAERKK